MRPRIGAAALLLLAACARQPAPQYITGPIVPDPTPAAHRHAPMPAAKLHELEDDFARLRKAVTGQQP